MQQTGQGGTRRSRGAVAGPRIIPNPKLRLLDQVREVLRLKHYSIHTERSYCDWIRQKAVVQQKAVGSQQKAVGSELLIKYLEYLLGDLQRLRKDRKLLSRNRRIAGFEP